MALHSYTVKAGFFDRGELFRLSLSLGFPGDLLILGLDSAPTPHLQLAYLKLTTNKYVSDRLIRELLQDKHLNHKLEKVFNSHTADYNKKAFLKAMSLLKHKRLTFSDISDARVAFELYSSEDGAGMHASVNVVLRTLKMLDKVISPMKLKSEIQKQQGVVEFSSRIQLYEFFDLVIKCAPSSEVEKELESLASQCSANASDNLLVASFSQLLLTKDEQISSYLDKQYRKSLYKNSEADSTSRVINYKTEHTTSQSEESAAGSRRQIQALIPALEYTQHQLLKARNGFTVFTRVQHQAVESLHASRQASWASSRPFTSSGGSSRSRPRTPARRPKSQGIARTPAANLRSLLEVDTSSLPKSKSVPLLPSLHVRSKKVPKAEEAVEENLTETISRVCEKSVLEASSTLRLSMTSIPQFNMLDDRKRRKRPKTADPKFGRHKVNTIEPLVTEQDIAHHRSLMCELEWKKIERKWQHPNFRRTLHHRSDTVS